MDYFDPAQCSLCRRRSPLTSSTIGICRNCVASDFTNAQPYIEDSHIRTRLEFGLPGKPPDNPGGVLCKLCSNECQIAAYEKVEHGAGVHKVNIDELLEELNRAIDA